MNSPRFQVGDRVEINAATRRRFPHALVPAHRNPGTVIHLEGRHHVQVEHDGADWEGGTIWRADSLLPERLHLGTPEPHPAVVALIRDLDTRSLLFIRRELNYLAVVGRHYPGRHAAFCLRCVALEEAERRGLGYVQRLTDDPR